MRLAVIGLGKLGAPLAAVMAWLRHDVIGADVNEAFVEAINDGRAPVSEPELEDLLERTRGRLRATTDVACAVKGAQVSFVIVPTPSDTKGAFSLRYVIEAIERIGLGLRGQTDYHVVNIVSTVMPGSCDGEIRSCLERASGRRIGEDLGLTYNPEFIALGSVIRDMLNPDFILIGESDARAGDMVERIYGSVALDAPVKRMSLINAEIAKLAVNAYVTTKISYGNMLADICDHLPGADVGPVLDAVGCDSRIGPKYLKAGLGYGGPCFPRDSVALSLLARANGASPLIAEATDAINAAQIGRVCAKVREIAGDGASVAVLGMAYKPLTAVIEQSQGVGIARALAHEGRRVVIYDPVAADAAKAVLPDSVERAATLAEAVAGVDVIVIATAWDEFRALVPPAGVHILDCWRMFGDTPFIHHMGQSPCRAAQIESDSGWHKEITMSEWIVTRTEKDAGVVCYDAICGEHRKGMDMKPPDEEWTHERMRRVGFMQLARMVLEADEHAKIGDCEDFGLDAEIRYQSAMSALMTMWKAEKEACKLLECIANYGDGTESLSGSQCAEIAKDALAILKGAA